MRREAGLEEAVDSLQRASDLPERINFRNQQVIRLLL